MNNNVLLRFEHKNDVIIIVKLLYRAYKPQAGGFVMLANDCDVISMFKM